LVLLIRRTVRPKGTPRPLLAAALLSELFERPAESDPLV
jgi:hypothetical protein